jgi:hypothetical protein
MVFHYPSFVTTTTSVPLMLLAMLVGLSRKSSERKRQGNAGGRPINVASRIVRIPGQARRHFSRGEKCVWVQLMLEQLFSVRPRVVFIATSACVVFLFGIGLSASTARAQSDVAASAPWQAHPDEGQEVPPPDTPCGGDAPCGLGGGCSCHSRCNGESCDEPCNAATDWLHMFDVDNRLSFRAEYLAWWTKSPNGPALATTSPSNTPRSEAGVLGETGTEVLYSGSSADLGMHSGGRFNLGYWFTPCHYAGFDITYTFLGNTAATYEQASDGSMILARPFYNVGQLQQAAGQDSSIIAYPNEQTGVLGIRDSQEVNFVDALLRWAIIQKCDQKLDFLFGYRYGRFNESLAIDSTSNYISDVGQIANGTVIQTSDLFDTRNEFNGLELGFQSSTHYCRWSLDFLAKLALGNTRSRSNVNGSTTIAAPDQSPVVDDGGLLALSTNSGSIEQNHFSVIPELGLTLGYDVTCQLKATVGYTFVYWSSVMRPGDQIDTNINTTQLPPNSLSGMPSPQSRTVMSDFWAHGLNVGLDYRF